ncbi:MAG: tol-pal system-associated acyl-CoA thioesterase [Pseudomarimonas sp.]
MSEAYSFSWPLRVYWEDTDAGGVVYHASYVRFIERARTEWLRSLGVTQSDWQARADRLFAVSSVQLDFLKPARLDDALDVSVELVELRGASMVFAQQLRRPADGALLLRAKVRAVSLAASTFRPAPIPEALVALMTPFCLKQRSSPFAE